MFLHSKFVLDHHWGSISTYNQEIFPSVVLYKTTPGKVTREAAGGGGGVWRVVAF
jgi:hypothetical protein